MSDLQTVELNRLREENTALRKTVDALVRRHECSVADSQSEFSFFQQRTRLQEKVNAQAAELGTTRGMLNLAMHGTSDGFWCYSPANEAAWYSGRFLELLGLSDDQPRSLPPTLQGMIDRVHPGDRPAVLASLRADLDNDAEFDLRFRMRTERSGYRWFRARGRVIIGGPVQATQVAGSIQDIQGEIEAEERLLDSERFAHAILDGQISPIVILDQSGTVVSANTAWQQFCEEHGVADRLAIGCDYLEQCRTAEAPYGTSSEMIDDLIRAVLTGNSCIESFVHEAVGREELRWYRVVVTPITRNDHRFAIVTHYDVTEEVQRQTALAEADEEIRRLALVAQHTNNGVAITDRESRIELINDGFTQILGCTAEEAVGRSLRELLGVKQSDWSSSSGDNSHGFDIERCYDEKLGGNQWLAIEVRPIRDINGELERYVAVLRDVTHEHTIKHRLDDERRLLESIISTIPYNVYWKDQNAVYLGCNQAFARSVGYSNQSEIVGKTDFDLPWDAAVAESHLQCDLDVIYSGQPVLHQEVVCQDPSGHVQYYDTSRIPLRDSIGDAVGVLGISADMTDRKSLESQLVQAQKLESIGQLAAGIAHEINTPTQYVADNTRFLAAEFENLISVIDAYASQLGSQEDRTSWEARAEEIGKKLEEIDYEFLRTEVPLALTQSIEGVERIAHIVGAMKEFSHPGTNSKEPADINKAIDSTVTVCRNRWRYAADLELRLDPTMPPVPCLLGEFNQVILNLVVNAADAIESNMGGKEEKGKIIVETLVCGDMAEVRIVDNGGGIPDSIRDRVFDPFFTTKEVGKGTGQGLAISRDVVVQKHGGELLCETQPGVGTTFIVRIPLVEESEQSQGAAA